MYVCVCVSSWVSFADGLEHTLVSAYSICFSHGFYRSLKNILRIYVKKVNQLKWEQIPVPSRLVFYHQVEEYHDRSALSHFLNLI